MRPLLTLTLWRIVAPAALLAIFAATCRSEQYGKSDRELAAEMLQNVAEDVRQHYYDPKYHGVDWNARVQEAKAKIDAATSLNVAMSEIANLLATLNDSHTFFSPPPLSHVHDYGFQIEMIGHACYVVRVRHGSDAEKKGLKPGDEIRSINENSVSHQNFSRLIYVLNVLRPQTSLRLTLVDEAGHTRQMEVTTSFKLSPINQYSTMQRSNYIRRDAQDELRLLRARYFEMGKELLVVKLPAFAFTKEGVDDIIAKMRSHQEVIVDLRGNTGGYLTTLDYLLGGIFENDVKTYDRVERESTKPILVKGRHQNAFTGRLIVLIDSESASASEVFARVIQLQKRGTIVGDRSSGRSMEAKHYHHQVGSRSVFSYGVSVTEAEMVMTDGSSLEHMGVGPDTVVLPTPADLANNRDPVLAKAAEMLGVQISPEEAGKILPYQESESFNTPLSLND